MNKIKRFIQKARKPFDEWMFHRKIKKLADAIWKYCLKDSLDPKYTKDDAVTISMAIHWNDADAMKNVLSYKDSITGNTIFPR